MGYDTLWILLYAVEESGRSTRQVGHSVREGCRSAAGGDVIVQLEWPSAKRLRRLQRVGAAGLGFPSQRQLIGGWIVAHRGELNRGATTAYQGLGAFASGQPLNLRFREGFAEDGEFIDQTASGIDTAGSGGFSADGQTSEVVRQGGGIFSGENHRAIAPDLFAATILLEDEVLPLAGHRFTRPFQTLRG